MRPQRLDAPVRRGPRSFVLIVVAVVASLVASLSHDLRESSATHPCDQYMLASTNLRFGGGGHQTTSYTPEASLTAKGLLKQPFYLADNRNWYKLTFGTRQLDTAVGAGVEAAHWTGSTTTAIESAATTLVTIDGTAFTTLSTTPVGGQTLCEGYGTLVTNATVTVGGHEMRMTNEYTLATSTSAFLRVSTSLTATNSAVPNAHLWVGTGDDWIGDCDVPGKRKGNLTAAGFAPIGSMSDPSNALEISIPPCSGNYGHPLDATVLFFSDSPGVNTVHSNWGDFMTRVVDKDPISSDITSLIDGSYAIHANFGTLAKDTPVTLRWYYAAAGSNIGSVISDLVADAANPPTVTAGDRVLDVEWTAPSSSVPITGYVLRHSPDGSTWTEVTVAASPLAYRITGLANGTEYRVQVAALTGDVGSQARGAWSSSSDPAAPYLPASAPTVSAWTPLDGAVVVEFQAPAYLGDPAASNLEYSTNGGTTWQVYSPASITSPVTISGLTNNTPVSLAMRAVSTPGGPGTASATVQATAAAPLAWTAATVTAGQYNVAASQPLPLAGGLNPVTVTHSAGTLPPGTTLSGTSLVGTPTQVGTWTFTLTASDSRDPATVLEHELTWVIERAAQAAVSFTGGSTTLFGTDVTLSATGGSGSGALEFRRTAGPCTVSGATLNPTAVGSCSVEARRVGDVNFLDSSWASRTITIDPAPLTIGVANATKVYGEADPAYEVNVAGLVSGDTAAVITGTPAFTRASGETVGAYSIAVSGLSSANYTVTTTPGTLTITPRPVSVSGLTVMSRTFDGTTTAALSGVPVAHNLLPGDDVTVSGTPVATFANPGPGANLAVTISGLTLTGADASNYVLTSVTVSGTVNAVVAP